MIAFCGMTMRRLIAGLQVGSAVTACCISVAAGATTYNPIAFMAPFTLPCCLGEMAVVDLNGDGYDDIIVASFHYPLQNAGIPVQIFINNKAGGFVDGTATVIVGHVPTTVMPRKIVVADFNGDGRNDVFIADHGYDASPFPGAQSTLLLSMPDGRYVDATANLPQQLAFTHSATAADIDGSGRMSLYLGNIWGQQQIGPQLLLNDGTGHFTISTGRLPDAQTDLRQNVYTSSTLIDLNGDGCPDLALGGDQTTPSVVLKNDCTGHFSAVPNAFPAKLFADGITLDIQPIVLGAFGRNDLLVASTQNSPFYEGRAVQVLINNGDATFRDESAQRLGIRETSGDWIKYARLTPINGNCLMDLLPEFIGPQTENRIYLNDGSGHFVRQTIGLPQLYSMAHPIDINHDGRIGFVSAGGNGFYLTTVQSGSHCTPAPVVPAAHDFNADGKSDVLWRHANGAVGEWLMNGGSVVGSAGFSGIPPSYGIVGQRDFNGDGKTDWLWRGPDGNTVMWLMNGLSVFNGTVIGVVPPAWSVAGTGDFNGDGKGDILWRDTLGNVAIWLMNGPTTVGSAILGQLTTAWTVNGTGDFNGDGKADILFRDTGGYLAIWFMNGTTVSSGTLLGQLSTAWTIAGTGDFNGDGKTDIVFRDTLGYIAIWLMDGSSVIGSAVLGPLSNAWSIVETGDYNGDRKADILFRDTQGATAIWYMSGTSIIESSNVTNPGLDWTLVGQNAD